MARYLPEHLPTFGFDASPASLRLVPRPQSRLESLTLTPSNGEQQLRKRRSVLSMTLEHILPSRSSPTKAISEHRYTASRYSGSFTEAPTRYRCDILAVSSRDFAAAEAECKQLVIEAGGRLVDQQYPGGFIFDIVDADELPIVSGDQTVGGGSIVVEPVETRPAQQLNIVPPVAVQPQTAKKWNVKSEHRLRKRSRGGCMSPFEEVKNSRKPWFGNRGKRRVTLMEMLIEELEDRRQRDSEIDWVTLDGDE